MPTTTAIRKPNRERIADYLHERGSITALEAVRDLHPPITALSQEITRMEQDGWVFEHIREQDVYTHWTRYRFVSQPDPKQQDLL